MTSDLKARVPTGGVGLEQDERSHAVGRDRAAVAAPNDDRWCRGEGIEQRDVVVGVLADIVRW